MKFIITFMLLFAIFSDASAQESNPSAAVIWVNKNMLSLATYLPGSELSDLTALDSSIGNSRIVAVGECTHGSSEIFSMKHRLLQYLATKKGFTLFAIEAAMPESFLINEYVLEGKGDPLKLLGNIYSWTWNTQEVLDMIIWMKKYNETAKQKIMFTGIDMGIPNGSIKALKEYASAIDLTLLPTLNAYDSIYMHRLQKDISDKKRAAVLENLANAVYKTVAGSIKEPDTSWVMQHIELLKQYALNLGDKEVRDRSMAKNAEWILQKYPGQKMMIWAHNDHVKKEVDKFGKVPMGNYLKKRFGDQYLSMGFATAGGTYSASLKDKKTLAVDQLLTSPDKNAVEYIFKDAAADNFIIDVRKAKKGEVGTEWIFQKMNIRDIGAYVNEKYQFFQVQPIKDFDMLIFLKTTHSSVSLLK